MTDSEISTPNTAKTIVDSLIQLGEARATKTRKPRKKKEPKTMTLSKAMADDARAAAELVVENEEYSEEFHARLKELSREVAAEKARIIKEATEKEDAKMSRIEAFLGKSSGRSRGTKAAPMDPSEFLRYVPKGKANALRANEISDAAGFKVTGVDLKAAECKSDGKGRGTVWWQ